MRRVAVELLEPGMIVARSIFDSEGNCLLGAGVTLTDYYIQRLKELGIVSIYVEDDLFDSLGEIKEPISEQTRLETIKEVRKNFQALEANRRINTRHVKKMVDTILDELMSNREVLINLSDIRTYDDYTFSHSCNVCVLSLLTGITLGYNELKLKELGIGALLHDIGKIRVSKELLNKRGELTKNEYAEIKKHAAYGFDILRTYEDIPLLSAHIAFQHHERWDGKGYPRGLNQEQIHEYARIVAVADVYDALLADRPYRSAYSINQAVAILNHMSGLYFEPRILAALVSNVAVYPIGSVVMLNTGEIGVVVDVNRNAPTRPVVRVVLDRRLLRLKNPHEVDLSNLSTVYIARVLTEQDIIHLKSGTFVPQDASDTTQE
ncbi:MAG TPA: HD-GYP domain-containing protein [Syntrophothermus lipocalidus]|nr:HD-GYP domain-containing protein [Syntrophothermus lipocalidus]